MLFFFLILILSKKSYSSNSTDFFVNKKTFQSTNKHAHFVRDATVNL